MKILGLAFGVAFGVVLLLCLFTPDKDKHGNFTQPYKYWTDKTYFERNFLAPTGVPSTTAKNLNVN